MSEINIKTLETPRLLLRQWHKDDFEDFERLYADPQVMKYLTGRPQTKLEAWRSMAYMVGHWQLRGYGHWAVEEKESGRFIGRIGFLCPEGWPGFEIGWTLAQSTWGKGYATEGAKAALEYGTKVLGQNSIISLIHPDNLASKRVAEKLGGHYESDTQILGIDVNIFRIV